MANQWYHCFIKTCMRSNWLWFKLLLLYIKSGITSVIGHVLNYLWYQCITLLRKNHEDTEKIEVNEYLNASILRLRTSLSISTSSLSPFIIFFYSSQICGWTQFKSRYWLASVIGFWRIYSYVFLLCVCIWMNWSWYCAPVNVTLNSCHWILP